MKFFDSSKRVGAGLGLGALLAMASSAVSALPVPWQLNMTKGVTKTSQDVYQIHMWAFYVCCVIGVIVFGAMIIAMFKFRKSKGAVAAKWSHNTKAEIVWTVVPILILVVLAAPATGVMINMAHTQDSQMTVKITGYQWKWRYEYLNWGEKAYHVNFISKLDGDSDRTRQLIRARPWAVKRRRERVLLNVDHALVLPTDTKSASSYRRRRDPRLVGAAARLEAGCDPRHHQRRLDRDP
jgi:cytochrome c oxidase subunit 2